MKVMTFVLATILALSPVMATEVLDSCWLEQYTCTHWHGWHCSGWEWVAVDSCEALAECRMDCGFKELSEPVIPEPTGSGISWNIAKEMVDTAINNLTLKLNSMFNGHEQRLKALEYTLNEMDEMAFCRGKVSVMLEYELPEVSCNGNIYKNINGRAISVSSV